MFENFTDQNKTKIENIHNRKFAYKLKQIGDKLKFQNAENTALKRWKYSRNATGILRQKVTA